MGLFKRRSKDNSQSDSAQTGQNGYGYQQNGYGYQQNGYGYPNGYGYGGYGYPQGAPNAQQEGQNGYGQNGYPGYGYQQNGYGGYPGYGYPGYGYPGYGGYGYGYGPMSNYISESYPQEDYGDPNAQAADGQAQQAPAAPQNDMANTKTANSAPNNETTNAAPQSAAPEAQPQQPAAEPQPAPQQAQPAPEAQPQEPAPEPQPQQAQPQEAAQQPAPEAQPQQPQPQAAPPGESDASQFVDVDLSKFQGDEALKAEAEDLKRKWYTVTAEYENYRKRTQNTRIEAYKEGRADVIKKLFPIGDNLDRAIKSCQDETTRKGIEMVLGAFAKLLETEEIVVIDPVGQPFDPNECEAIMAMDPQEGQESGIVLEVYVKGYKQGDKVLRYAQVIVTK